MRVRHHVDVTRERHHVHVTRASKNGRFQVPHNEAHSLGSIPAERGMRGKRAVWSKRISERASGQANGRISYHFYSERALAGKKESEERKEAPRNFSH